MLEETPMPTVGSEGKPLKIDDAAVLGSATATKNLAWQYDEEDEIKSKPVTEFLDHVFKLVY